MLLYRRLHEIVLIVLIIGIMNIYDVIKNVNISIYEVININDKNMMYILLITLFFFLIFLNKNNEDRYSLEFEIILALGLIGLNILLISNDLIIFFLSLELYSLSVYLLLFKNELNKAKITILYFLIGSISSSIILLGIAILYKYSGSLDLIFILQNLEILADYHYNQHLYLFSGLALFLFGLLFKLGAAPFYYWVIRVYSQMDIKILTYQSIVPKIVYILILISIFKNLNSEIFSPLFIKLLLFSAFLSLFLAPIGGLTHGVNQFKTILAYSSTLHVGFLLLGLAANSNNIVEGEILNIFQYLTIYGINTFQLLLGFYILQNNENKKVLINKSLFLFSLLISLFSFIGLPPFAGFYAKLNIFLNCFNTNNEIFYFAIFFMLISTLISSFLYLKFIHYLYFSDLQKFLMADTLSSNLFTPVYLFSFFSLFLLFYPLFLPYLSPFFEYFSL